MTETSRNIGRKSLSPKPATVSLDLDNQWSYMRAHGVSGWQSFPSYLPKVVPKIIETFESLGVELTVFVVGLDAEQTQNQEPLQKLAHAGYEIGNHSYFHDPLLRTKSADDIRVDIRKSEAAIGESLGVKTRGFRGPGFGLSRQLVDTLLDLSYEYDASTYPTIIGPLAKFAYFRSSSLTNEQKEDASQQFGKLRDGLLPLHSYRLRSGNRSLVELPVSTLPMFRLPVHLTYLHYLAQKSPGLAKTYFRLALAMFGHLGVAPSLLLHPLDFVAADECRDLSGFPGFGNSSSRKRELTTSLLIEFCEKFQVMPIGKYLASVESDESMQERTLSDLMLA